MNCQHLWKDKCPECARLEMFGKVLPWSAQGLNFPFLLRCGHNPVCCTLWAGNPPWRCVPAQSSSRTPPRHVFGRALLPWGAGGCFSSGHSSCTWWQGSGGDQRRVMLPWRRAEGSGGNASTGEVVTRRFCAQLLSRSDLKRSLGFVFSGCCVWKLLGTECDMVIDT